MEDLGPTALHDPKRINVKDPRDVRLWSELLGCAPVELMATVAEVGSMSVMVALVLAGRSSPTRRFSPHADPGGPDVELVEHV
jgi:Protein of unknown function (DUF3606)